MGCGDDTGIGLYIVDNDIRIRVNESQFKLKRGSMARVFLCNQLTVPAGSPRRADPADIMAVKHQPQGQVVFLPEANRDPAPKEPLWGGNLNPVEAH
jgi:hypothetical protein